jgi:hypothetical protein
MQGYVNRRVFTSTDGFLDASRTGGIPSILVRPGAIHAFLEVAVRSFADDPSRNSPYRSARLTSAKIVRTSGD